MYMGIISAVLEVFILFFVKRTTKCHTEQPGQFPVDSPKPETHPPAASQKKSKTPHY